MKKLLLASMGALILSHPLMAIEKKEIQFHGQNGEAFELEKGKVKANVQIDFKDVAQANFNLGLGFKVEDNGDVTEQVAPNTGTNLLVLRQKEVDVNEEAGVVQSDVRYTFTIHDRLTSLKPISQEIKVTHLTEFYLSFILGQTHLPTLVKLELKDGDKTLLSKNLGADDVTISPQEYGDFVSVKIKDLGVNVKPGQKLNAEISVAVVAPGAINLEKDKLEKRQEFKDLIVK